uniref:hypothetical protein n=1 Tax=Escherichia coli TaxID=562 RepID=UPI001F36DB4D|nr:hypothetical protein [Escherichia coli]
MVTVFIAGGQFALQQKKSSERMIAIADKDSASLSWQKLPHTFQSTFFSIPRQSVTDILRFGKLQP